MATPVLRRFCLPFLVLFFSVSFSARAQEPTIVQTLTLDSEERSGDFDFPAGEQTWEKIIMRYQMRCHDAAVGSGNVGCYEWDYSCNTFITDDTRLDSNRATHPNYTISNFSGTEFNFTSQPTYTYYQFAQTQTALESAANETIATIGTGTEALEMASAQPVQKAQFLYLAEELLAGGLQAGDIQKLNANIAEIGGAVDFLRIKLKPTTKLELSANDPDFEDFTEVYFSSTALENTGDHSFYFSIPFAWDGSSNIIVELSYTRPQGADAVEWIGSNTAETTAIVSATEDRALDFGGAGAVDLVATPFATATDAISVTFWAFGNEAVLPTNTTAFEALGESGERQLNVHLPWSNSRVYWDCGAVGSAYNRIDKEATAAEIGGNWNHWAYVKDANTGQMRIYLNGSVWHTGSGMNNPIQALSEFRIGSSPNGNNPYFGKLDEFRVWQTALDETTINDWMRKPIDATHPEYDNLIYRFAMDEASGQIVEDSSPSALNGTINGVVGRSELRGKDLFKNFVESNARPNLGFGQGDYTLSNSNVLVLDSILNLQDQIVAYGVEGTDLVELETTYIYAAGETYVYNEAGEVLETIAIPSEGSYTIESLDYYNKFDAKFEILSLVTPYGNGLDLGAEGKVFTFDVTDYAPILKDTKRLSVEMGGQFQEELDISFEFYPGTPVRPVLDIQNVWPFRRGWFPAILADDVFEPRSITLNPQGDEFVVRSSITGHGQNGEFVERTHYINVNGGAPEFEYNVWQECSEIPIYPQGGTWLFDRAGWCPGDPSGVHRFNLSDYASAGETVELDYGLLGANMEEANYLVANQLVTYGAPSFATDAAIVDIIKPSKKVEHERFNPTCSRPVVVIRNNGTADLTSLTINYTAGGGMDLSYDWTGNLAFLERAEIELPVDDVSFWGLETENVFTATVTNPNGVQDEYTANDAMDSPYKKTVFWEEDAFRVNYTTNNRASENTMYVRDSSGEIVLQRTSMQNNTEYNDALALPPGCYTLEFNDTGDDGLYYWYWAAVGENVGTGNLRIQRNAFGDFWSPVKSFQAEFGGFVKFDFTLGVVNGIEDFNTTPTLISVRPNPAQAHAYVDLIGFEGKNLTVNLLDASGRVLSSQVRRNNPTHELTLTFEIANLASGLYFIQIQDGKSIYTKNLIKQ